MFFEFTCQTAEETKAFASKIGRVVRGGEVLAFHSDLGGGKTTFVKGFAVGMGVTDVVQSPTFTLSQIHEGRDGLELDHYDFYRLTDPGVMADTLAESLQQPDTVVAVEWGDIVHNVLPKDCIQITLRNQPEGEGRIIQLDVPLKFDYIIETLKNLQQK